MTTFMQRVRLDGIKLFAISSICAFGLATTELAAAADLGAAPAGAPLAEAASPIGFNFGAAVMTDYNFRGITQTNRGPAVQGYGEVTFYDMFYVGAFASNVRFARNLEIDVYGGIRPTFGPLTFDFGFVHYFYPGTKTDFTELYGKVEYTYENFTVGANVFHAWDIGRAGQSGTYAALTASVEIPQLEGLSISGEVGRYFLGSIDGVSTPDYTYWNIGPSYTFDPVTVDLRYHDTERHNCAGGGTRRACGSAVIATLSVDF